MRGKKGANNAKGQEDFVRTFGDDLSTEERVLFQHVTLQEHEPVEALLKNFQTETNIWLKRNEQNETLVEVAILKDDLRLVELLLSSASVSCSQSVFASICQNSLALANTLGYFDTTALIHSFMKPQQEITTDSPDPPTAGQSEQIVLKMIPQLKSSPVIAQNGRPDDGPSVSVQAEPKMTEKVNDILLVSAAIAGDFIAMQELIKEGHVLRLPDNPSCRVADSLFWSAGRRLPQGTEEDSVSSVRHQMEIFEAFASPDYIILKEEDPILAALKRSEIFSRLANFYPENKETFKRLASTSSRFALDLLSSCQSENEVKDILTPNCGCASDFSNPLIDNVNFGRLRKLVGLKQTEFVTHPICQRVIYGLWLGHLRDKWPFYSNASAAAHILVQALVAPFLCFLYTIDSKFSFHFSAFHVPMNRFIYSVMSYVVFLLLLSYSTLFRGSNRKYRVATYWNDWLVLFWVLAHAYKVATDIFTEVRANYCQKCRFRRRWFHFWTVYELVTVIVFFMSSFCFFVARVGIVMEYAGKTAAKLAVVAEGLFSITITVAIIRVLEWFHLSRSLGHIIVSFSRMTEIIFRLLVVYAIVVFAFSFGLYTVYKDYHQDTRTGTRRQGETLFMTYSTTLEALFWAIFGQGNADYALIPADNKATVFDQEDKKFSVVIGYFLWGIYHISFVLILLNMLIAIMTISFEAIQDNCDREWKFARTKIWIYYFEEHNMVPPPFNLFRAGRNVILFLLLKCLPMKRFLSPDKTDAVSSPSGNDRQSSEDQTDEKTFDILIHRYMINRKWRIRPKNSSDNDERK